MSDDERAILFKEAIVNAYKYGQASTKVVLGKVLAYHPELRSKAKILTSLLDPIIQEINSYSTKEIEEIIKSRYPEEAELPVQKEKELFPPLPGAIEGKVKVRYPPEPSKHPHIGQMLSFCINHLIAQKYKGKTVLRFDDTNPDTVKAEYYESFREAINWMNLQLDQEVKASDYMTQYYEKAKYLINNSDAYVCFCSKEDMGKLRDSEKPCSCNTSFSIEKNLDLFDNMLSSHYSAGEAVVRMRGDMSAKNAVLRDPVLLRISATPHCYQKDKYVVWPMYDFESPIMEEITNVTHVLRSMEFGKMREELQSFIAEKLKLPVPVFYQYSRYNVIGSPTQGRIIRDLVEQGIVSGWDDIRLVSYQALRKRGIQPDMFIELVKQIGITKSKTNIDWSLIASINRQILNLKTKHYFFVPDPVKIKLINRKPITVTIPRNPDNKELGTRNITVDDYVYLTKTDESILKINNIIRLKDLYNIKILEQLEDGTYSAECLNADILPGIPRIQWVTDYLPIEVIKPELLYLNNTINKDSLQYINGYVEKNISETEIGEIVQFERFGFIKINAKNNVYKANYVHG